MCYNINNPNPAFGKFLDYTTFKPLLLFLTLGKIPTSKSVAYMPNGVVATLKTLGHTFY